MKLVLMKIMYRKQQCLRCSPLVFVCGTGVFSLTQRYTEVLTGAHIGVTWTVLQLSKTRDLEPSNRNVKQKREKW